MVEGIFVNRQANRGILGNKNRDKARTPHTTADRVKAVLGGQRDVRRQLRQLCYVILESLLKLCSGNRADCNRQILLRDVSLGSGNHHLFKGGSGDLVILCHSRQSLRGERDGKRQCHLTSGEAPGRGFGRHGVFPVFVLVSCGAIRTAPATWQALLNVNKFQNTDKIMSVQAGSGPAGLNRQCPQ